MEASAKPDGVTIKRTFKAPVARVFAHFVDPRLLQLWHSPAPALPGSIDIDARVGGSFRFAMYDRGGNEHVACGTYQEYLLNRKLVFTWYWEKHAQAESTVTILFKAVGEHTEVTLHHEGLGSPDSQQNHRQGWGAMFHNLEQVLV